MSSTSSNNSVYIEAENVEVVELERIIPDSVAQPIKVTRKSQTENSRTIKSAGVDSVISSSTSDRPTKSATISSTDSSVSTKKYKPWDPKDEKSELNRLINKIAHDYKTDKSNLSSIKNPLKLYHALCELRNMIGNTDLKDTIAKALNGILWKKTNGKLKNTKLNIVLYGGPGVGKTTIARHIGKIYDAAGIIKARPVMKRTSVMPTITATGAAIIFLVAAAILIALYIAGFISGVVLATLLILFLMITIAYWYNFPTEPAKVEEGTFIEVDKSHFDAEFLGQTSRKVNEFLDSTEGKVIFFDEAYSLIGDARDLYGREGSTLILKDMTDNPDARIWIFAGYEDKINEMFEIQPGFVRRFTYKWTCNGYTISELYQIWKKMIVKESFTVDNDDVLYTLFEEYKNHFPYHAGDCETLAAYTITNSNPQYDHTGDVTVTPEALRQSLEMLKSSHMKEPRDKPKDEGYAQQLLSYLGRQ